MPPPLDTVMLPLDTRLDAPVVENSITMDISGERKGSLPITPPPLDTVMPPLDTRLDAPVVEKSSVGIDPPSVSSRRTVDLTHEMQMGAPTPAPLRPKLSKHVSTMSFDDLTRCTS